MNVGYDPVGGHPLRHPQRQTTFFVRLLNGSDPLRFVSGLRPHKPERERQNKNGCQTDRSEKTEPENAWCGHIAVSPERGWLLKSEPAGR